jgi:phage terminase large subunit-like protein
MSDLKNHELIMDQGIEMIEFYRNNPCIAAYDLLRVDLAPIQRVVFEDMWFKNYVITIASRGLGKTFLLAALATLSCLLYPGYRVGLMAPVFRQSKLIFAEVEKLYTRSPIVREAAEKRPVRGSDTCYLRFKSVHGVSPSYIEALPLGDGTKIRGSRFYLVVVDELAQVPDKILDMVIRPMAATTLEPMENVRRI